MVGNINKNNKTHSGWRRRPQARVWMTADRGDMISRKMKEVRIKRYKTNRGLKKMLART